MTFKPATKSTEKMRMAIYGPSGSGKTFTALRIATGMGGKIAVIDTEYGSASKYADRFTFDTEKLKEATVENYIRLMEEAGKAGYSVLVIDSLTHGWHELLDELETLKKGSSNKDDSFRAWGRITPKQKRFIKAILESPCHLIATMRAKTEWDMQRTDNGKIKPVRVGLAPEQGKGIEYEFDTLMVMDPEHFATIEKDRTGLCQDRVIEKPGEKFGEEFVKWLSDGKAPSIPPQAPSTTSQAPSTAAPQTTQDAPQPPNTDIPRPKGEAEIMAIAKIVNLLQERYRRPVDFDKVCAEIAKRAKNKDGSIRWPAAPKGILAQAIVDWAIKNLPEEAIVERAAA